jgi:hypothetical protein
LSIYGVPFVYNVQGYGMDDCVNVVTVGLNTLVGLVLVLATGFVCSRLARRSASESRKRPAAPPALTGERRSP